MSKNAAQQLIDYGQSVWYDNISRDLLKKGEIKRLIAEWGVRGMTSNPTIFDKAIGSSSIYDQEIVGFKAQKLSSDQIFDELAIGDIGEAADLLLPMYKESGGTDGFVSIEVSPLLAANTQGSIDQGKRLFSRLNRPNIMIKIPGTPEGLPAVRALLEEGIHVNITLLFSVDNYVKVANTYCEALRTRVKRGQSVKDIRSVASFFVSRVDTSVDKQLDEMIKNASSDPKKAEQAKALRGKFGIANCRIVYKRFQDIFYGQGFADLKAAGAAVQRPLWASTGTKDPAYRDVVYVEELIGKDTVNTMPHQTLEAFVDHGVSKETITKDLAKAESVPQALTDLGIDLKKVLDDLQTDGVKKFSESFETLNATINKKLGQ